MKLINYIKSEIRIGIAVLLLIQIIGLVGIYLKGNDFAALTPYGLLITFMVLIIYHQDYSKDFNRYIILIFAASFAIELMALRTGRIFGEFYYGLNLGFLVKNVPLIIGVNWLILCLSAAYLSNLFVQNIYLKSALAALLIVLLVFFIEQVAPALNFWYWKDNVVPIQNFVAWFVIAFFFQLMIWNLKFSVANKIAPYVFTFQLLFFVALFLLKKFNLLHL